MFTDVLDLEEFYKTPLGRHAIKVLTPHIEELIGPPKGQNIVGLGYTLPFLTPYLDRANHVTSLMPARQGIIHWPSYENNRCALTFDTNLPLADVSVDTVLMVHELERAGKPNTALRECWRVLADDGQLIIVIPNRRGIWARSESNPFGQGRPYSRRQILEVLRDNLFTPTDVRRTLYVPPTQSRWVLSFHHLWQSLGRKIFPRFSGAIIIQARKRMYAGTPVEAARQKRRGVIIPTTS